MVTSVEKSAKTVQEAIELAVQELGAISENVEVEVLEEGNKGLFGIIGGKMAKVKVTIKPTSVSNGSKVNKIDNNIEEFLLNIIQNLNIHADVEMDQDESKILVRITGQDVGILIGRRGETLDAIQYLASIVANRKTERHKKVIIDIESYRERREEALVRLANKLANRVVKHKKSITLEPMTAYERRVIHAALQTNKLIDTYSIGEEPYRKIVIKLR